MNSRLKALIRLAPYLYSSNLTHCIAAQLVFNAVFVKELPYNTLSNRRAWLRFLGHLYNKAVFTNWDHRSTMWMSSKRILLNVFLLSIMMLGYSWPIINYVQNYDDTTDHNSWQYLLFGLVFSLLFVPSFCIPFFVLPFLILVLVDLGLRCYFISLYLVKGAKSIEKLLLILTTSPTTTLPMYICPPSIYGDSHCYGHEEQNNSVEKPFPTKQPHEKQHQQQNSLSFPQQNHLFDTNSSSVVLQPFSSLANELEQAELHLAQFICTLLFRKRNGLSSRQLLKQICANFDNSLFEDNLHIAGLQAFSESQGRQYITNLISRRIPGLVRENNGNGEECWQMPEEFRADFLRASLKLVHPTARRVLNVI